MNGGMNFSFISQAVVQPLKTTQTQGNDCTKVRRTSTGVIIIKA